MTYNDKGSDTGLTIKKEQHQISRHGFDHLKWGDFLLYALIAGLSVLLFLWPYGVKTDSVQAVLTHKGEIILVIPAEQLQKSGSIAVDAEGYHYLVVYQECKIRFAEADCPDLVCVKTGWISRPGQMAACVPGQLILKIEGSEALPSSPDDVDVILR